MNKEYSMKKATAVKGDSKMVDLNQAKELKGKDLVAFHVSNIVNPEYYRQYNADPWYKVFMLAFIFPGSKKRLIEVLEEQTPHFDREAVRRGIEAKDGISGIIKEMDSQYRAAGSPRPSLRMVEGKEAEHA